MNSILFDQFATKHPEKKLGVICNETRSTSHKLQKIVLTNNNRGIEDVILMLAGTTYTVNEC